MVPIRWVFMFLMACVCVARLHAETALDQARSTLEKWVETRQLISKTRSDWQSDKEMLEQSILLLERELAAVDEQMGKLSTNSTQAERERGQAEGQLKASKESLERSTQFAADFEGKIKNLVPKLPTPLQEILKPLLARMPPDMANTKMLPTERVQVVVGVLNELDKFNNGVSIFSEKRKNDKGEEVAVETVYIGLGAAYFVNEADDFAGTGSSGPNGWEWNVRSDLAASVREAIRIYRNERPAKFISLPVAVK